MTRTVTAITAIFLLTTLAWIILGGTILARTFHAETGLSSRVESTWGSEHAQRPPSAFALQREERVVQEQKDGTTISRVVTEFRRVPLLLERSRVQVTLDLDQRRKGLLWFPTYHVGFRGDYLFRGRNADDSVEIVLAFPAPKAVYDGLLLRVDGRELPLTTSDSSATATLAVPAGSMIRVETGYRSQGMRCWTYVFGEGVAQARDFALQTTTNFGAVDFPDGSLSPTEKQELGRGWRLTWRYRNVVTGSNISITMPEKLQPGPLAGRISFFAPVSLLFFFFLIFIITTLRGIDLHPMHYFFLAAAFFAFHLLLAYLVDHISIHLAFIISGAVSLALVVSYLRIVVSSRFAWVEAALAQMVYLVLFSYAFFFKGFTGLSITIGAVLTLFLVMQMTARIDWRTRERKHETVAIPAAGS